MKQKLLSRLVNWLKERMPGVWENVLASIILAILGSSIGLLVLFKKTLTQNFLSSVLLYLVNIKINGIILATLIILISYVSLKIFYTRRSFSDFLSENKDDDFQFFKKEIILATRNYGFIVLEESITNFYFLTRSKNNEFVAVFVEPSSQTDITRVKVKHILSVASQLNATSCIYVTRIKREYFDNKKILTVAKGRIRFTDYFDYRLAGVNILKYLEDLVSNWENTETSKVYIHTTGRDSEGNLHVVLDKTLDNLISDGEPRNNNVIVLGDFGSGKTTFLHYYSYVLAKRYIQFPFENLIPVFISLREYEIEGSIEKLISKTLGINHNDFESVINLIRDKLAIIFDAFDEMTLLVDRASVQRNIQRIDDIASKMNGALIVSCRTHFFRDSVEEDQLVDFTAIHLEPWSNETIDEYLQKSLGNDWEQARKVIYNTYNLHELAQTPLFLDMTIDSLDSIQGKKIYSAELYKIYTQKWINKQIYKAVLDADQKQEFMEKIAWKMLNEGRAFIPWVDLRDYVQERFNLHFPEVDRFDNDIRTCSFLTRQDLGYAFIHKSFMEFFVASYIAKQIFSDNITELCRIELSEEVIDFLGQMVDALAYYERLHLWLEYKVEAEYALARRNAAHILRAISRLPPPELQSAENRMSYLIDIVLSEQDETNRWRAIVELSWLRSSNSKNILRKTLSSDDKDIRVIRMASLALGLLADEEALPIITRLLFDGSHFTIRQNCAVALGLSRSQSAIPSLIESLAKENEFRVRRSTIWAIESIDPVAARTPLTTTALNDPSEEVRQYAAMAFGRLGGNMALEVLEKQLQDKSPLVRKATIDSLGKIGGSKAETLIKGLLNDLDFSVREACKHALNLFSSNH